MGPSLTAGSFKKLPQGIVKGGAPTCFFGKATQKAELRRNSKTRWPGHSTKA